MLKLKLTQHEALPFPTFVRNDDDVDDFHDALLELDSAIVGECTSVLASGIVFDRRLLRSLESLNTAYQRVRPRMSQQEKEGVTAYLFSLGELCEIAKRI